NQKNITPKSNTSKEKPKNTNFLYEQLQQHMTHQDGPPDLNSHHQELHTNQGSTINVVPPIGTQHNSVGQMQGFHQNMYAYQQNLNPYQPNINPYLPNMHPYP